MSRISVNNLTFSYDSSFDNIFENVSFSIDTDWKLGFIGRNGKGKTTFLNLLLGKYKYAGSISKDTVFDYFPNNVKQNQMELPAAEFIDEIKNQCEIWRVIIELDKLNEDAELLYRPFGSLSPGERTKILLAVLFSGENDFMLIDEPTNHLDYEARENVKKYLSSKKSFILVSHDRDLLDACVNHVLVLNRRTIEVQSGNFSSWWENKQKKDNFAKEENEKHLSEISRLKQSVARVSGWGEKSENSKIGFDPIKEPGHGGKRAYIGSKTKKMQARVKHIEKRIEKEIEEKEGLLNDIEKSVDLKIMPMSHHKKTLVDIRDYSLKYKDAKDALFENLTIKINEGERIAIHGGNGCGKSTLIKSILQKSGVLGINLPVSEKGVCETASGLVVSYVNQDTSMLSGSVQKYCTENNLDRSLFFSILRQLGMERVQFTKNIEDYSEGQKKKLLIAASILTPAHLYVWDEPLNYIDVISRMQIEKLILDYKPTMLFVEHDIMFRQKIATAAVEL